jgi:hypothetical protein
LTKVKSKSQTVETFSQALSLQVFPGIPLICFIILLTFSWLTFDRIFRKAMKQQILEAVDFIKDLYPVKPSIGVVLGSGLGSFTNEMIIEKEVPYDSIPHFPVSTVEGHSGKLIFGEMRGKKVAAMAGRFHYYEGYNTQEVVFPIRVL